MLENIFFFKLTIISLTFISSRTGFETFGMRDCISIHLAADSERDLDFPLARLIIFKTTMKYYASYV